MKFEARCPACGLGYVVDMVDLPDSGGLVPCPACNGPIEVRAESHAIAPSPPPVPTAEAGAGSGDQQEVVCPRCNLHFAPARRRRTTPPGARPSVLVVEDMDYFLELIRDALSGRYDVRSAGTVAAAVASAKSDPPDVMLLDLVLSAGENGLDVLAALPARGFPVVVVTARDESEMYGENWRKLVALGVDDVVRKGMNMSEVLLQKVAAALGEASTEEVVRD